MKIWTCLWRVAVLVLLIGILGGPSMERLRDTWMLLTIAEVPVLGVWL